MRAVPATLDPAVVAEIDTRLLGVEASSGVSVRWAIESGSRAWGFPSPDSDYDCRFLYVHPADRYLSLWPGRDVIETPLDEVFDVNGWDLAKAVRLLVKGNVTTVEWLRSPIVYRGDPGFRDRLLALADDVVDRGAVGRHYLHVARQQRLLGPSLKKFLYALRPAVALRWLADHPGAVTPPMDLPTLVAESSLPANVRAAVTDVVALKAVTRELGAATPPAVLERFVDAELDRAAAFDEPGPVRDTTEARARADALFRAEAELAAAAV
ncbi:nucleotidyltransferase domain-containing protein [Isoptericola sp. QY 916]|uniref:nucleotidyltransferase domain-containing protein n=1 Tax=Isoptericola sp. QY 916 TaxID=2782570 RepID=UPI003D300EF3|nr:nucleotidyltransferase domain-containing protein [Isoptericola sp. QY 916]